MVDFAPWDELLRTYVDATGHVAYDRWQQEAIATLDDWLASLRGTTLSQLPGDEQLALLINVYNALTIRQVLESYPIDSVFPKVWEVPNLWSFWRFFTRSLYALDEEPLSLNQIEHGILRRWFREPRIHFALVCASLGCPQLRNEAYWGDRVKTQLEEDAQRFIYNPDKVRYVSDKKTLYCSKIFRWYGRDFLKVAASVPDYIGQYLPDVRTTKPLTIRYLPYDWSLNQRTSS
ncbi:MAG: DUF547 domain-containing protein [Cyanobacteria bacterium J06638_20]